MKKLIKYFINSHIFFITESPKFMVGTNKIKYYLKYPLAYIKFMYYSAKDYINYIYNKYFTEYEN